MVLSLPTTSGVIVDDQVSTCGICGNSATLICKGYSGYVQGTLYDLYACDCCDASFCVPRDSGAGIYDVIYGSASDTPGYSRYWSYAKAATASPRYMDYLVSHEESYWAADRALGKLAARGRPARVLDVGCGLGYFTYSLVQKGYDAVGIDISVAAVEAATNAFGGLFVCGDLSEFAPTCDRKFDAVILNQLVEHVSDPLGLLGTALGLLDDQGIAIITTPNKSLFSAPTIWETDSPPVHLWWFSESTMRWLAGRLGVQVAFMDFTEFHLRQRIHYPAPRVAQPVLTASGTPIRTGSSAKRWTKTALARIGLWPSYLAVRSRMTRRPRLTGARGRVCCAVMRRPFAFRD